MALDSSGNIAVDYVWGNFPLQPDTERGPIVPVLNKTTYAYDPAPVSPSTGAFVACSLTPVEAESIHAGYAVDITTANGATVLISGTVKEVLMMGSLSGIILEEEYTSANNTIFDTNNTATSQPKVKVYPKLNTGGGAGDHGWSSTTKVKSAVLDPTLDGHNITTEFWNNFPGYTPNAGFVPQQIWAATVIGSNRPFFQYEQGQDNPDMYGNQSPQGYVIRVYTDSFSAEDFASLQDAITSHALIGQRVPAINGVDYYNNLLVAPSGYIVGSDISVDAYGNTLGASIQVQVDNFSSTPWYNLMGFVPTGDALTLGVGDPKTVVLDAKVGIDFGAITVYDQVYGGFPYWDIEANSSTPLSDALKNALLNTENYPAYIGVGQIDERDYAQFINRKYNFTKITSAELVTGMYGQQVVRVHAAAIGSGWNWEVTNLPAWWDNSLSIAVIK